MGCGGTGESNRQASSSLPTLAVLTWPAGTNRVPPSELPQLRHSVGPDALAIDVVAGLSSGRTARTPATATRQKIASTDPAIHHRPLGAVGVGVRTGRNSRPTIAGPSSRGASAQPSKPTS